MLSINELKYNGNISVKKSYSIKYSADNNGISSRKGHHNRNVGGDRDNIKNVEDDIKIDSDDIKNVKDDITIDGNDMYNLDNVIEFDASDLIEDTTNDEHIQLKQSRKIEKTNLVIYASDNVMDFRHKVQLMTNIPLYKQHIYYVFKNRTYPMSYKISPQLFKIDARDIKEEGNVVLGVPVDANIANKGDTMNVVSYEEFRIMSDIISKSIDFFILSIDEVFKDRAQLNAMCSDEYTKNLLYYSFVIKYWPMMNLDIWSQYIKNDNNIKARYPRLHPENSLLRQNYDKTVDVMNKLASIKNPTMLTIGITSAVLYQKGFHQINLRNLFDVFQLSDDVPFMRCKCVIKDKSYEFAKTYKGSIISREKMGHNSVLIHLMMKLPNGTFSSATFHIALNGTYFVKTDWRSDHIIDWKALYSITENNVNPIIRRINTFGQYVLNKPLLEINKFTKLTDLSISMYWQNSVGNDDYKKLLNVVKEMITGGIIAPRQTIGHSHEYIFMRGMYKFNHLLIEDLIRNINNYYARLYDSNVGQKWEGLFEKNRIFRISHRYSDVRFDITNVKQEETEIVLDITSRLVALVQQEMTNKKDVKHVEKKLQKLKELDPELYDFKNTHRSTEVLSKKCQKPLQPTIYSSSEYAEYTKTNSTKNILEYWNFTINEPAYYKCDNPKYPYVQFITGVHPLGYCIPCCKKISPLAKDNNKKNIIHKTCLSDHHYDEGYVDEKKSRYVSFYGKDLDPGRLSYLSDEILGSLFYDHTSDDDECRRQEEYYMLGVNQYYKNIHVGILYCVSFAMEITIDEAMHLMLEFIRQNVNVVRDYIENIDLHYLLNSFKDDSNSETAFAIEFRNKWNKMFMNLIPIVFKGWKLVTIRMMTNNAFIDIPNTLKQSIDFIDESDENVKIIIVIQKPMDRNDSLHNYYPVIFANKDNYYKDGEILKSSFDNKDKFIHNILDMVSVNLIKNDVQKLDLSKVRQVSKINTYFMNNTHHCYAVLVEDDIYVPIHSSFVDTGNLVYKHYDRSTSYEKTVSWVTKFNKVASKQGWDPIITNNFVYIQGLHDTKKRFIGFEHQQLIFYCKNIDDINYKSQLRRLYYDPVDIIESSNMLGQLDQHELKLTQKALYNKNLYKMVILEFISLFGNEKNMTIRKKLKKYLMKNNLFKQYKSSDIDHIIKYEEDRNIIKMMISEYLHDHQDKMMLMTSIDHMDYKFDKSILNNLKESKSDDLVNKLITIGKQHFIEDNITDVSFENMYMTCSDNINKNDQKHCRNKKLIIPKGKLQELMEILAYDIKNDLKEATLFSRITTQIEIDLFRFRKYPYETIVF